jgi:glycosyltransferase involved in cell wall biosynthesis
MGAVRLLCVISNLNALGGMEAQLVHLAGGLVREGHQVRLVSIRSSERLADGHGPAIDPGVDVVHLGARGRNAQVPALRRLVAHARASDLVHLTGWDASLWGRLAGIAARRPVVMAEHTPGREHQVGPSGAPRGKYIAWHNRVLDPFTARTVICAEWQRDLLRGEGVAGRKIVMIPNGVPVAALRAQAASGSTRAGLGIPDDAKVVVHVARFTPQKRHALTLETVARLREALGDVRVLFAGAGPELERMQALAASTGAGAWATFLGRVDDVASLFGLADLAVLPSSGEAMPMSIVEAIAVGTPVVATDVGDVGAILDRTGAGLHVPVDDPDAFYEQCRRVLSDDALHARLAAAATAAAEEIDAAAMARRYAALFGELLG